LKRIDIPIGYYYYYYDARAFARNASLDIAVTITATNTKLYSGKVQGDCKLNNGMGID